MKHSVSAGKKFPSEMWRTNRRDLLLAGGLLATGFALGARRVARAETLMELDGRKITTVSDGNLVLPVSFLFPDVEKSELIPLLEANKLGTEALEPELNITLVEDGDRKILFDAGSGSNFMPSAGELPQSLAEAGIDPSTITDVVFTHGHPDHLWGILDDFDEITFPDANLHFPRVEWEFWNDENTVNLMSEGRASFAIGARNRLEAMGERVNLFDAGSEVLPGIEAVDTRGHTPGHTSFVVHGGSQSLMVVGDALTNHVVSFEKPGWFSGSDQDPQQGVETRLSLLDRLAGDRIQIIGYHLPNGGLGRVEKSGDAYRFVQG